MKDGTWTGAPTDCGTEGLVMVVHVHMLTTGQPDGMAAMSVHTGLASSALDLMASDEFRANLAVSFTELAARVNDAATIKQYLDAVPGGE